LAQFRELEAFMQFAQDLDPDTKRRIEGGQRLMATLKQKNGAPIAFERQSVIIYSAVNGYLAEVAVERVPEFEEKFLTFLDSEYKALLPEIAKSREMSESSENTLKAALEKFKEVQRDLFVRS
jgi:F-type H+-transporting ATPase subunit alpha